MKVASQQFLHDHHGSIEFIHLNKTGGSSIEGALGMPFCHQTAEMRIARLGVEEWNRRYSFTVVRNPWDRLVSQYHYRRGRGRIEDGVDFPAWVQETLVERSDSVRGWGLMFATQFERISNYSGDILVDDVYRFESFGEAFDSVCRRLGIVVELPHRKPSNHDHYSLYYDQQTVDVVGEFFADDVRTFEYEFEYRASR